VRPEALVYVCPSRARAPYQTGDTLPGQADLYLIPWSNIQILPAPNRAQTHPLHLFIIQLHGSSAATTEILPVRPTEK
jgi:hypothetical protein